MDPAARPRAAPGSNDGARTPRTTYYSVIESPVGPLLVAGDGRRLRALKLVRDETRVPAAIDALHRELKDDRLVAGEHRLRPVVRQLREYFAGRRQRFDCELDLAALSAFRREVLLETARVPHGAVASYREIAARTGRPGAYRATGNALGGNPIAIVIPCHRVIASDGGIGGYGGGLAIKQQLLGLEIGESRVAAIMRR